MEILLGTLTFLGLALFSGLQFLETSSPIHLIKVVFNLIVVALLLLQRKTSDIDDSRTSMLISVSHTFFPVLYNWDYSSSLLSTRLSFSIFLMGTLVAMLSIVDLSRSFGIIPANRGVRTSGTYRFVRHPIYLGYIIAHIGLMMLFVSWLNGALFLFYLYLTHLRISREEVLLLNSNEYINYVKKVKAKIIPCIY